jgi:hypothetical protein
MSQFAFLQVEFRDVFEHAARVENLAHSDPRAAAFYCRLALETAVEWLYRHDRTLKDPFEPTLAAHLAEPTFQALLGRTLCVKARGGLGCRSRCDAGRAAPGRHLSNAGFCGSAPTSDGLNGLSLARSRPSI